MEYLAAVSGGVIGFLITYKLIESGAKEEKERIAERAVLRISGESTVRKVVEERPPPKSLDELVEYIATKYMLSDVTLLTSDGLPIVSNSKDAERSAATAPEIMRMARSIFESEWVFLDSGSERLLVAQVSPDVLLHARTTRELTRREVESLRSEVGSILEGLV